MKAGPAAIQHHLHLARPRALNGDASHGERMLVLALDLPALGACPLGRA